MTGTCRRADAVDERKQGFERRSRVWGPSPGSPSRELVPVAAHPEASSAPGPQAPPSSDRLSSSRFALAAAAAIAVVVAVAGALVWEHRQQSGILAERARETQSLAQTIKSLKVRLDAIDAAKSRDDLADLRQSVGEMKSTVVSAREFNSALALLAQRVDKLDNEESAKVDKLSERVDHEGSALTAELSSRVDKLEKKIVAPIPAPSQTAQAEQPPVPPKFGADVSMETTGVDRTAKTAAARLCRARRPDRRRADRRTLWRAGSAPGRFSPRRRARRAHRAQRRAMDGAHQRRRHRLRGLSAVLTAFVAPPRPFSIEPAARSCRRSADDCPIPRPNPGDRARRFR